MAFWGISIKPREPLTVHPHNPPKRFRISHATLGECTYNSLTTLRSRSVVRCAIGNRPPVHLFSIAENDLYSRVLDFEFEESEDIVFSAFGHRVIHLAGYYLQNKTDSLGEEEKQNDSLIDDSTLAILPASHQPPQNSGEEKKLNEHELKDSLIDDNTLALLPDSHQPPQNAITNKLDNDKSTGHVHVEGHTIDNDGDFEEQLVAAGRENEVGKHQAIIQSDKAGEQLDTTLDNQDERAGENHMIDSVAQNGNTGGKLDNEKNTGHMHIEGHIIGNDGVFEEQVIVDERRNIGVRKERTIIQSDEAGERMDRALDNKDEGADGNHMIDSVATTGGFIEGPKHGFHPHPFQLNSADDVVENSENQHQNEKLCERREDKDDKSINVEQSTIDVCKVGKEDGKRRNKTCCEDSGIGGAGNLVKRREKKTKKSITNKMDNEKNRGHNHVEGHIIGNDGAFEEQVIVDERRNIEDGKERALIQSDEAGEKLDSALDNQDGADGNHMIDSVANTGGFIKGPKHGFHPHAFQLNTPDDVVGNSENQHENEKLCERREDKDDKSINVKQSTIDVCKVGKKDGKSRNKTCCKDASSGGAGNLVKRREKKTKNSVTNKLDNEKNRGHRHVEGHIIGNDGAFEEQVIVDERRNIEDGKEAAVTNKLDNEKNRGHRHVEGHIIGNDGAFEEQVIVDERRNIEDGKEGALIQSDEAGEKLDSALDNQDEGADGNHMIDSVANTGGNKTCSKYASSGGAGNLVKRREKKTKNSITNKLDNEKNRGHRHVEGHIIGNDGAFEEQVIVDERRNIEDGKERAFIQSDEAGEKLDSALDNQDEGADGNHMIDSVANTGGNKTCCKDASRGGAGNLLKQREKKTKKSRDKELVYDKNICRKHEEESVAVEKDYEVGNDETIIRSVEGKEKLGMVLVNQDEKAHGDSYFDDFAQDRNIKVSTSPIASGNIDSGNPVTQRKEKKKKRNASEIKTKHLRDEELNKGKSMCFKDFDKHMVHSDEAFQQKSIIGERTNEAGKDKMVVQGTNRNNGSSRQYENEKIDKRHGEWDRVHDVGGRYKDQYLVDKNNIGIEDQFPRTENINCTGDEQTKSRQDYAGQEVVEITTIIVNLVKTNFKVCSSPLPHNMLGNGDAGKLKGKKVQGMDSNDSETNKDEGYVSASWTGDESYRVLVPAPELGLHGRKLDKSGDHNTRINCIYGENSFTGSQSKSKKRKNRKDDHDLDDEERIPYAPLEKCISSNVDDSLQECNQHILMERDDPIRNSDHASGSTIHAITVRTMDDIEQHHNLIVNERVEVVNDFSIGCSNVRDLRSSMTHDQWQSIGHNESKKKRKKNRTHNKVERLEEFENVVDKIIENQSDEAGDSQQGIVARNDSTRYSDKNFCANKPVENLLDDDGQVTFLLNQGKGSLNTKKVNEKMNKEKSPEKDNHRQIVCALQATSLSKSNSQSKKPRVDSSVTKKVESEGKVSKVTKVETSKVQQSPTKKGFRMTKTNVETSSKAQNDMKQQKDTSNAAIDGHTSTKKTKTTKRSRGDGDL